MKYFECIGPGKGKISGYVQSLTPHKKWRPCSKLDTKLAEVTNAQKKQRVEDQSDPPFDPGTSTGCTCLPAVWHFTTATHPCLRTCTHAHLSACAKATHPFWLSAFAKAAHPS